MFAVQEIGSLVASVLRYIKLPKKTTRIIRKIGVAGAGSR